MLLGEPVKGSSSGSSPAETSPPVVNGSKKGRRGKLLLVDLYGLIVLPFAHTEGGHAQLSEGTWPCCALPSLSPAPLGRMQVWAAAPEP